MPHQKSTSNARLGLRLGEREGNVFRLKKHAAKPGTEDAQAAKAAKASK
jgi:hypothetical protein